VSSCEEATVLYSARFRNSEAIKRGNARFERTVLLLQGGGALGSYQAGVYQALAEADLHPDWVAGISIGAESSSFLILVSTRARDAVPGCAGSRPCHKYGYKL